MGLPCFSGSRVVPCTIRPSLVVLTRPEWASEFDWALTRKNFKRSSPHVRNLPQWVTIVAWVLIVPLRGLNTRHVGKTGGALSCLSSQGPTVIYYLKKVIKTKLLAIIFIFFFFYTSCFEKEKCTHVKELIVARSFCIYILKIMGQLSYK